MAHTVKNNNIKKHRNKYINVSKNHMALSTFSKITYSYKFSSVLNFVQREKIFFMRINFCAIRI